jgi:hypothetical protein
MPRHLKNQLLIVALILALFFISGALNRYREINSTQNQPIPTGQSSPKGPDKGPRPGELR